MGRGLDVEKDPKPRPKVSGDSDVEEVLLGRALSGDAEAAHWLVALFQSQYHRRITGRMKSLYTGAHTGTIEDVFQDTIIRLMERLQAGELKDLPPEDRQDILKYFQRLCDGRLRDVVRARISPALSRRKEEVPEEIEDENVPIPGVPRHTEHLALVKDAIGRLDPQDAQVLRKFLDGMSYEELARETGRGAGALRMLVLRLKQELQLDIVPRSATAQLKFQEEAARIRRWPRRSEIEAAIAVLPPEIKESVVFVHIEHRSVDELARKLGQRGCEKAQARLEQAYRSLSGRMKAPFPEAFEKAAP
jgi:RNA polymerase sigma factor (sigma-70 family)